MKTKSIKKLVAAAFALVLSTGALVGCAGGKPKELGEFVTLGEAAEWNNDTNLVNLDGKYVTIKNVILAAEYEDGWFSVQNEPALNTDPIYALEIRVADMSDWTFDIRDKIHVTGTVSSEDGRPILVDAWAQWGTGGEEKCKGAGAMYYYPGWTRAAWDTNVKRAQSGVYYEANLQIAALPSKYVEGERTSMTVVFPGEDLNLDYEDNYFGIEIFLPGYTGEKYTYVNEWLSQFKVGDGVNLFFQAYFKRGIKGILPYTSFRFTGTNEATDLSNVFEEFGDVETEGTAAHQIGQWLDESYPCLDTADTYSFVVDNPTIELNDGIQWRYEDTETGLPVFLMFCYSYNPQQVVLDVVNSMNALVPEDFTSEHLGNKYWVLAAVEGEEEVEAFILVEGEVVLSSSIEDTPAAALDTTGGETSEEEAVDEYILSAGENAPIIAAFVEDSSITYQFYANATNLKVELADFEVAEEETESEA